MDWSHVFNITPAHVKRAFSCTIHDYIMQNGFQQWRLHLYITMATLLGLHTSLRDSRFDVLCRQLHTGV